MKSLVCLSLLAALAVPALALTPTIVGIQNNASFTSALSPGGIAALYGTDLAPTSGNTTVTLGGKACYVRFVSAGQVNIQLPVNLGAGTYNLVVTHDGLNSAPFKVTLTAYAPAIFTLNSSGSGPGKFTDGSTVVSTSSPAKIGDTVSGYGIGLGTTSPVVATGVVAPSTPPASTLTKPTVTVGGVPATVTFSGLEPGQIGLYQVNFVIPEGVVLGAPNNVVWTINGVSSPPVTIQIFGIPTTTKLTAPGASSYGQAVTLTAMVTPSTATGAVTFYDGVTVLGTSTPASGIAEVTTSLLASGKHSLRAYYGGSNSDEPSESAALALAVSPSAANDFAPVVSYAAGSTTSYAAVGDFNGDGKQDLVVINYEGTVNVLLGKGDGTFQPAILTSSGTAAANDIATGDFNGDGKTDLALSLPGFSVGIMLGKGDGTFQPAVEYSAGLGPISIAVADFNGDGKADIVVANNVIAGGGISVLLGNGDGTFRTAAHHLAGTDPFSVAVGDFNGDGKADIAVGDIASVNILLGNGDGTFLPFVTLSYTGAADNSAIVVGDFNGDGKADIAASGINGVGILLGKGDGTFEPGVVYPAGNGSMVSGDFNGDGKEDLAVGGVYVLLGNGDGTFQADQRYGVGSGIISLVIGDFNRDGKADLALASEFPNSLQQNTSVLLGKLGSGTAQTITFAPLSNVALGVTPFKITATASSGRPVVFSSTTPKICTVGPNPSQDKGGGGTAVFTVSGGLCSIAANQSGNAQFPNVLPAPTVTRSFTVIPPAPQTITFAPLSTRVLSTGSFALSATATSNLAVTFTSNSTAVCTVSGIEVMLLKLGTCSITASQAGNSAWAAAAPVTRTFTVSAGPPAVVSLSPSAGAGKSVTFKAVFSDPNGAADLNELLLEMNSSQSGINACYVYYQPQGNHLYLASNTGVWITPALTPGAAGTASNSQCTLNGATSSVATAGNDLTLTVALTFNSTFVTARNLYLYAAGLSGENSGWIREGTWTPNPIASPPAIVSLSPAGGAGTSVKFAAVYSDPNGAGDLSTLLLEMNSTQSSANACYVYYQPQGNHLYLANNLGAWITPALTPGVAGTASNSQCTLNAATSSVTTAGNNLTLSVALAFNSTFLNSRNVYLYAAGYSGLNSGWVKDGTFTPNPVANPPAIVSLSPSAGAGTSATFKAVYSDPNGAGDLSTLLLEINTAQSSANACYVYYQPQGNHLYLASNAGAWITPALTPGVAGTVSNSQCTLNAGSSSVSTAGNNLTLSVALSFNIAFAGSRNVYLNATGYSGLSSGWVKSGAWTP
jgi:uncharacterized protein (TIGR03437 family)